MINIRGDENRKIAVEKYELEAVSHLKLLNGQTIESSAGSLCRDRYYIFNYKPKNDDSGSDEKTFYCGYSAAEKLLELLGEAPLPLFNPLTNRDGEEAQVRPRGDRQPGKRVAGVEWAPINRELYDAINLLFICWKFKRLYGRLKSIFDYLKAKPEIATKDWAVIYFNNLLKRNNCNLEEMVNKLREKNSIRRFHFPLMNAIIGNENNCIGFN